MGPFCFRPRFDSVFVNLKACGVFSGIGDDEPFLLELGNQSIDRFFYIFAAARVPITIPSTIPPTVAPLATKPQIAAPALSKL